MNSMRTPTLVPLRDTDLVVADERDDIRGRKVIASDGQELGEVKSLFVDEDERRVRFFELETGGLFGLGAETRLVPIEAIEEASQEAVRIGATTEQVQGSPPYDPQLAYDLRYFDDLHGYYGFTPY